MLMDAPRIRAADPAFYADVLAGLEARPRAIPARWFYDETGSELFEQITQQPEYYPTRAETALLRRHGGDIGRLVGAERALIEFGSGSSTKTPIVIEAIAPSTYIPIDISGAFLRASAAALGDRFPALPILPIERDFLHPLTLPGAVARLPRLGFFPGSTIGNLPPAVAVDLLRAMADTLGEGSLLLIGMDRLKDPAVLLRAYDDAKGITARFNLNLLRRINRELEGDIPERNFCHRAVWNEAHGRIEMHLEARDSCRFNVAGHAFAMDAGETIHTENSHKYGLRDARMLLRAGEWSPVAEFSDAEEAFLLVLAEAWPAPRAP